MIGLLAIVLIVQTATNHQKVRAEDVDESPVLTRSREKSLAQIIRQIIDLPQIVAAGGSRGIENTKESVCLISPVIDTLADPQTSLAVVPKPVIATKTPLNEIIIREAQGEKKVILKKTASTMQAVKTPIYWPLNSFPENKEYILELRPRGAARAQSIQILLKSSERNVMEANEESIQALHNNRHNAREILKNIAISSPKLAIEIAFDKRIEHIPEIKELRKKLQNDSCQNLQDENNEDPQESKKQ